MVIDRIHTSQIFGVIRRKRMPTGRSWLSRFVDAVEDWDKFRVVEGFWVYLPGDSQL